MACLDKSRHQEVCEDKAGKPFKGLSKSAKRRSQQTKTTEVSSVDSHDNTEVAKDVSSMVFGIGKSKLSLARLRELGCGNAGIEAALRYLCQEDSGGSGWHHPLICIG